MSSEDESDGESSAPSLSPHKRARPNDTPIDVDRQILDVRNKSKRDGGAFKFVHGEELVKGEARKKYDNPFGPNTNRTAVVELQYPSDSRRERYVYAGPWF